MIHAKDIKGVLSQIPSGTTISISDIQELVKDTLGLTSQDWEIHTNTRPTNYRKWLHRIQGVLSEYKRKGKVTHNPSMHTYTFK